MRYTFLTVFGLVLILVAFLIYKKNTGLDFKKMPKIVGRIAYADVTRHSFSRGGTRDVFAFKVDEVPVRLGVYRSSQDYADLVDSLHPGDLITVYFRASTHRNLNLDVFQIEKNGVIILSYKEYIHTYFVLSLWIGLLGLFFFAMSLLLQLATAKRASKPSNSLSPSTSPDQAHY